jgi:hypothetical protein
MSSIIKRIEYLNKIFAGISLNVRSKISDEIEEMFTTSGEFQDLYKEPSEDDLLITLKVLEGALKDAKKDYKEAKKSVKTGSMPESDLVQFKQAVNDLIQQIKDIKSSLNG